MRAALMIALAGLLGACASPPASGPKLAALYGDFEYYYRADSRFRTDYDPPDAPIDPVTLEQSFLKLAFNSEPQQVDNRTIVKGEEIHLLRWPEDVSYIVIGGSPDDHSRLFGLGSRIGNVIGRRVQPVKDIADADIRVFVLDGAMRARFRQSATKAYDPSMVDFIDAWVSRPEFPCIGMIDTDPVDDSLAVGVIFIKAELGGDFRRACFTEEFTQVFGLINDDPDVRPSIFNDDQEFIELTRHDEYLLKVLYDPRLSPGMTEAEARPLLGQIVRDVVGRDATAAY